jgi:PAS domain S-box-containing protein
MKTSAARSELLLLILFDELQVPIYLDKLKNYGYQNVISCTQGEEAIKKLASCEFSLVITDTELKGKMNGIDLGRKVMQEYNLSLIYLSRLQDETTLSLALETKPRAFLSMPVNWNELRVAIESAMLYNDEVTSLNSVINEFTQRFEEAPLPYQILDGDGRLTSVNKAWINLMGYSANEVIGKWFGDFMTERFHSVFKQCFIIAKKAGSINDLECDLIKKDGRSITIAFDGTVQYGLRKEILSIRCVLNDITEKQKIKENLLESEKRFRILFEEAPLGYQSLVGNGDIIYVNNTWCKMLGYSKKEAIGKWFGDFLAPEGRDRFKENFSVFRQKGVANDIKYKMIRKDGAEIYIMIDSIVRYDEERNYIQSHCILKNITAQKLAEDALLESEKKFRNLIESAGDIIYVLDHDLKYLYGNNQCLKRYGLTKEELIGRNYRDLYSAESLDKFNEKVRAVQKSGKPILYEHQSSIDGRYFLRTLSPITDSETKEIESMIVISRDITGLKKVEQALLKRENEIRTITDNIPALVSHVNADGHYSFVNQQYEKWFGIPSKEIIGKHIREVTGEIVYKQIKDYVDKALSGQRITFDNELNYAHGGTRWVTAEYIPDLDVTGKVSGFFSLIVDITERKRAEEAIRESEQKLKEAQTIGKIGSWEFDVDHGAIEWSDETYKLYERDMALGPPTPDEEASYYTSEQAETLHEYARRAIETGEQFEYDLMPRLPSGRTTFFSASIRPIRDESGRIVKLSGTVQDITERRRVEKILEESESMLRIINENVSDIIWRIDADTSITYLSPSVKKILGYRPEEILGQPILNFIAKEYHHSATNNIRKRASQKKKNKLIYYEYKMVARDGRKIPIEVSSSAIRDDQGNITGFAGISRDISERKAAEIALKESEVRYKDLVEKAGVAIIIDDMEGKLIYANKEFSRLFGYTMKEINKITHRDMIHPDDFERVNNIHRRRLLGERAPTSYEFRSVKKNGNFFWTEIKVTILKRDGKYTGTRSYMWDIDQRKEAEKTLKFSEARFRELFSHMSSGVALNEYVSDLDEIVLKDMNEAGFRITQIIDKEKAIGKNILSVFPAANNMNLTYDMKKVWRSGKSVRLSTVHFSDDRIDLYIDYYIYKLPSGEIVLVFDNITERILAEQNIWHKYEEIKKLSRHLETVREEERKMIARDLHDDLGQILTAVKMDISWIRNKIPVEKIGIKKRSESAIQIVDQAIQSIRRISSELRPVILDDLGLFETLIAHIRDYENRFKIIVKYKFPETESKLKPDQQISVFRIIQEALTNTARHSGASAVDLDIREKDDNLKILIRDNGTGIPDQKLYSTDSFGLISMRERVLQWGGRINISGKENEGTSISISIPI